MKKFKLTLIITFMIATSDAQNYKQDKQITDRIRNFYNIHCKLWATKPLTSPDKLYIKLDSLQKQYCTALLRKKAKSWFLDGHDLLTNDWGIDPESLNTLRIRKVMSKDGIYTYTISYIVKTYPVSPYDAKMERITFQLGGIIVDKKFMINSIK
ncbi:hypothetical protein KHS38_18880 [Mucilaginibacter sp. Bleaf8]|uniref:hypothetical protein n=1 Tax=Mucilaginibacter sp. Bleaf8 TaxID=2834430 RepID=UPI001BD17079|nr:hypothetical protein [Mucilaginibacter sp. Bleaf8]MBS7566477.1 hypothetical protein [Mucilaginibacter sp. Bleaf8]